MSLPSPLALRNGNPEYIEYPEIPRDGDPAGAIDWLEIGSFFASIVSAAMITSAGSLSFTGRCIALVSLLAPGVAFVDSLCMAIVEKKHGLGDVPSELIFTSYRAGREKLDRRLSGKLLPRDERSSYIAPDFLGHALRITLCPRRWEDAGCWKRE